MKLTSKLSLTVSALALVLAAPSMASAKAVSHVFPRATVSKVSEPKVTSGQIDTTGKGDGTYTKTVSGTKDDKTVTVTDTFDGKSYTTTSQDITIVNANGSVTHDDTITLANGKTIQKDTTVTSTGVAGDYTISGTVTNAKGVVIKDISGTKDKTSYGENVDTTITAEAGKNAGKTETLDDEVLISGGAVANVVNGTGFNGQAISHASLVVPNGPAPTTGTVDTTVDGQGTITVTANTLNGVTTREAQRDFQDGTVNTNITTAETNSAGVKTIDGSNVTTTATGSSSNSTTETLTPTGTTGDYSVSGTFVQSNGYAGTYTGSQDKTSYGTNIQQTYTSLAPAPTATKSIDSQQLIIGNTVLNVNTATTFAGQSANTAGLVTAPTL